MYEFNPSSPFLSPFNGQHIEGLKELGEEERRNYIHLTKRGMRVSISTYMVGVKHLTFLENLVNAIVLESNIGGD